MINKIYDNLTLKNTKIDFDIKKFGNQELFDYQKQAIINTTNALLAQMRDKNNTQLVDTSVLGDFDTLLSNNSNFTDSIMAQFKTFGTNVQSQYDGILTQFKNTKAIFNSQKSFSVPAGNTANCLSFTFKGKVINFDLCSSFSIFSPIVYFVVTIMFMISTFKFMVNNILKGID